MFKLYQDLDGCLADYCDGVSHWIWMLISNRLEIQSKSSVRKIRNYIRIHGRKFKLFTEEDLHRKEIKDLMYLVASQKGFFSSLKRIDNDLLEKIEDSTCFETIHFLTAPIGKYAEEDKKIWCKETLNSDYECIVVPRAEKMQFAGPYRVIVDDNEITCIEWRKAGGIAFQWPKQKQEFYDFLQNNKAA